MNPMKAKKTFFITIFFSNTPCFYSITTALVFKLLLITNPVWSGNFYTAILMTHVKKATVMTRDSREEMLVCSAPLTFMLSFRDKSGGKKVYLLHVHQN